MNKHTGFTLAESLLVMVIVCSFALLPTLALKRWQEILEVEHFLSQFEKGILLTRQSAITKQQTTLVQYYEGTKTIEFVHSPLIANKDRRSTTIVLPEELTMTGLSTISFPGTTGNYSQPEHQIHFCWAKMNQKITYQFLFGSGSYEKIVE